MSHQSVSHPSYVGELELKFRLDRQAQARLAESGLHPDNATSKTAFWTAYFDTADGVLAAHRFSLRVRRSGDGYVQAVKADTDIPFERFEWEQAIDRAQPRIDSLPPIDTAAGALIRKHFEALEEIFVTQFERICWRRRIGRSLRVEIAADRGDIRAGERTVPLAEIEIERLAGDRTEFYRWVRGFAQRCGLSLAVASKSERGLRLIGRLAAVPLPVKAAAPVLKGELTVGEAAALAVRSCLAHLIANLEPVMMGSDVGGPHQLRISLRRLRAAIRLFQLADRDKRWNVIGVSARHLAEVAGRVRDCDVFEAGLLVKLIAALPNDAALETLTASLARERDRQRVAARAALADLAFTRFVLSTAYLAQRCADERRPAGATGSAGTANTAATAAASEPGVTARAAGTRHLLVDFAPIRIRELRDKLSRRQRKANDSPSWHRARISAKSLRYALEFVGPALQRPKRARQTVEQLSALQELLGAEQDRATSLEVARRCMKHDARADPLLQERALTLIEGWNASAVGDPKMLRRAVRSAMERIARALGNLPRSSDASSGAPGDADSIAGGSPKQSGRGEHLLKQ